MRTVALLGFGIFVAGCDLTPSEVICTLEGRYAVVVTVADSVTGEAPSRGRLIARLGPQTEIVDTLAGGAPRRIGLAAVGFGPGRYDVTVEAEGYRPWTRRDVEVRGDRCGVLPTTLHARVQRP